MSDGITFDNIHLSEVTHFGGETTRASIYKKPAVQGCTDPKILEFIVAATASNTRRAYEGGLSHFLAWGGAIPAGAESVAEYIAAHAKTLSVATLARRIVAIRRAHALRRLTDKIVSE